MITRYQPSSQKKIISFSRGPPWHPLFIVIYKGGTFFDFFLLALRFRSKLKQDVNISPFSNHLMLKNPRALNTFLHVGQMKMYTNNKIVIFRNFCSPRTTMAGLTSRNLRFSLIFLLMNTAGWIVVLIFKLRSVRRSFTILAETWSLNGITTLESCRLMEFAAGLLPWNLRII